MPAHSFSPVAGFYDMLAQIVFGRKLQEAQMANLIYIADNSRILIIGGGSGWILQQVLQKTRHSSIVYLEASASMISKTEKQIKNLININSIEYRLGTEETIETHEKFDFIIVNFFLDLFCPTYLTPISEKLFKSLTPTGRWLITDFVQPANTGLPKCRAQILYKSMYLFFRVTCGISASALPDWENNLKRLPLEKINSAYFYHGLIKTIAYRKSSA